MASIAIEQLKVTAFVEAGFNEAFHRNTEHLRNSVDRFGGAFFKLRFATAYIVDGSVGNATVLCQSILRYFLFSINSFIITVFHLMLLLLYRLTVIMSIVFAFSFLLCSRVLFFVYSGSNFYGRKYLTFCRFRVNMPQAASSPSKVLVRGAFLRPHLIPQSFSEHMETVETRGAKSE